jgi:acyl-CoA thioesterase-1
MKCRGLAVVLAFALAACGDGPEAPEPTGAATAAAGQREIRCFVANDSDLPAPTYEHTILAFGDSLFAGYGLCPDQGYPEQLQGALARRGISARVIDAGVSGDTSAAGLQRIEFVLDGLETPPDLAIVELGGNDLLRGISPAETRANLTAILTELQKRRIPVLLMGMRAPPNLGEAYVSEFDGLYPDLAERYGAALVPFFLAPVWDKPALIQQDRIHPTAEGIEALVAATVDEVATALPADDD